MKMFALHGLILCVSEGVVLLLLCSHNVCIEMFDLHVLILCASEDRFSILLCSYIGCKQKQMLVLHGVI